MREQAMRVDALALHLRPRPMSEAADLGVMLVRTHARSVWLTFAPVLAVVALLALATVEIAPWLPAVIVWWLKPWLDRTLLFIFSRAAFGEPTRLADLWRERSAVLWRQLPSTLTLRRLSPWRSFTQPIDQLEGQRGKSRRKRRAQLLKGKRGPAIGMHLVFAHFEVALLMGVGALAVLFAPEGTRFEVFTWLTDSDAILPSAVSAVLYTAVVLLLEPFYVAAGFAMYLNRRVELEAWDIEQEFRRAFAH
jgi:hypothetical protein